MEGLDWPGRSEGLSDREAEILALVTQAKPTREIAEVTNLSVDQELLAHRVPQARRPDAHGGGPVGGGPRLCRRGPPRQRLVVSASPTPGPASHPVDQWVRRRSANVSMVSSAWSLARRSCSAVVPARRSGRGGGG